LKNTVLEPKLDIFNINNASRRTIAGMKLYLSSYGVPNMPRLEDLVGKELSNMQIGYILNAMDDMSPDDYRAKYDEWHSYWGERGACLTDIDLLKLHPGDIASYLGSFDLLWAKGGNTYHLRYAMRISGFDRAIRAALASGTTYGGDSAGALVAGPTLKYLEKADDPTGLPEVVYDGLGLVNFVPMPHWDNADFKAEVTDSARRLKHDGYQVRTLNDDQAVVINGDSQAICYTVR
jgi:dipeptidase E